MNWYSGIIWEKFKPQVERWQLGELTAESHNAYTVCFTQEALAQQKASLAANNL